MLREFQLNSGFGPKELYGKVAKPLGWGDRLAKDAPGFFFHRYPMVGGADAQTRDGVVVQFADT